MNFTRSEDAIALGEAAIAAIESHGISVPPESPLRADTELLKEHHAAFERGANFGELIEDPNFVSKLRRQVGAIEVLLRVVELEKQGKLAEFKGSLAHFKDAGVSLASPFEDYEILQDSAKNHTRLLYEFYVASGITLNSGLGVVVAGTKDTSQNNPDVLVPMHSVQGIACKVIACRNGATMVERLMDGANQIKKSTCAAGVVALDVRQCVDQDLLIPEIEGGYRTFTSAEVAQEAVKQIVGEIGEKILNALPEDYYGLYISLTESPCFIVTAQALAIVETNLGKIPTNINVAKVFCIATEPEHKATAELALANWIAQPPHSFSL